MEFFIYLSIGLNILAALFVLFGIIRYIARFK